MGSHYRVQHRRLESRVRASVTGRVRAAVAVLRGRARALGALHCTVGLEEAPHGLEVCGRGGEVRRGHKGGERYGGSTREGRGMEGARWHTTLLCCLGVLRGCGRARPARCTSLMHTSCTPHARLMHASCMSCGPPPWPPHCPSPAPSPCVQASPHLSSGDSLERGSARPSFITVTGRLGTFWSLLPGRLPCIWYLFWGVSSCRRRISGAPRTGKRAVAVRPPPYMERGMRSIGFKHRRLVAFDFLRS